MLHYILQTIAFQLIFLLLYDVFLRKETFFKWNRLYLLSTVVLSLILPFIKVDSFKKVVPQDYIISLPEVVIGQSSGKLNNTINLNPVILERNTISFWEIIFYIGLSIALCLFVYKLIKIFVLIIKNPKQAIGNIILVELFNSTAAFSFFHYIFLGERIDAEEKETILKHELIHTQQKHTLDLLFFELLRIAFWFNPLVYIYQNRMATLHEFIADANAVKHQDKNAYYQNLLSQVFETKNISFINTFFKQSLIKKRIVMLSKAKSKQSHLFKYALLIPMVFAMLIYTSAEAQEAEKENIDLSQYSYTSVKGEKPVGEKKKIHEKYESFLKKNKDYVGWSNIDKEKNTINYSVHNVNEKVPEGFSKSELSFPDGTSYVTYFKWEPKEPSTNFSKEKKEKVIELLRSRAKYKDSTEVPFAVVEEAPIFPGCESLTTNNAKKECMSRSISRHVNRNFNTDLATELGLKGRQRISLIFKIDIEGNITGVKSRAPHPSLEEEAIRVIKTLPKMIPGRQKGKIVSVTYSLPIIFQVLDKANDNETDLVLQDEVEVPFAVIENVPVYPGCEDLENNAEMKNCMNEKLAKYVVENFDTKKASEYGLVGRQRINVIFKIDTKGNIIGIKSRGPHPVLETEAIRVISSLPKMKPGMQKGKAVTVPYSLPIIFDIKGKQASDKVNELIDKEETLDETTLPFAIVEVAPVLPECQDLENENEKRECTSIGIQKFIAEKFNTKMAQQLGLKGKQRINIVFKITKKGSIEIEKSRAPHPDLEAEAIRVVKSIPRLIPGENKGEKIDVLYSVPIIFQVADKK
ncbi:M56 family metallopeptidase [Algibacter aquimarinus]|uniref:Uncharacterized protein n=1 Tax=Algibacter aquimarinus TaxID=1136748 RepID=A0ABP9H7C5_9FLAO